MDFKVLLIDLKGRISRQSYWIGLGLIIALSLLATMGLMPLFQLTYADMNAIPRPPEVGRLKLIVNLLVIWPSLAITIKRLQQNHRRTLHLKVINPIIKAFHTTHLKIEFIGVQRPSTWICPKKILPRSIRLLIRNPSDKIDKLML